MKKLKTIIWIVVLVLLSAPAGFVTIFTEQPFTPRSEYMLIFIVGAIANIILIGGLSLIPYFILKKNHSDFAVKRALQCYSFFIIAMLAVGVYKLPEATKTRDHYEFWDSYKPQFTKIITRKIESDFKGAKKMDEVQLDGITFCMSMKMEDNDLLTDKLIGATNRE